MRRTLIAAAAACWLISCNHQDPKVGLPTGEKAGTADGDAKTNGDKTEATPKTGAEKVKPAEVETKTETEATETTETTKVDPSTLKPLNPEGRPTNDPFATGLLCVRISAPLEPEYT